MMVAQASHQHEEAGSCSVPNASELEASTSLQLHSDLRHCWDLQAGKAVEVRSWVLWEAEGLLLLNMKGTRWCGNIQREHRSNGIFYVVDMQVTSLTSAFSDCL